jgi:hypothetical protein
MPKYCACCKRSHPGVWGGDCSHLFQHLVHNKCGQSGKVLETNWFFRKMLLFRERPSLLEDVFDRVFWGSRRLELVYDSAGHFTQCGFRIDVGLVRQFDQVEQNLAETLFVKIFCPPCFGV